MLLAKHKSSCFRLFSFIALVISLRNKTSKILFRDLLAVAAHVSRVKSLSVFDSKT